jgi:hypothetical protein
MVDSNGLIGMHGRDPGVIFVNDLVANKNNTIIGVLMNEKTAFIDSQGNFVGRLFPNGNVYNLKGTNLGKINGDGYGFLNNRVIIPVETGQVVDFEGKGVGLISYDGKVVNPYGAYIGRIDGKGNLFNDKGDYIGGAVKVGAAVGYDGQYLGYGIRNGEIIDSNGKVVGHTTSDGKIVDVKSKLVGEILPENILVDIWGHYQGYSNMYGDVLNLNNDTISAILPGGSSDKNLTLLKRGAVIDFSGNIFGVILPNGEVSNKENVIVGRVLSDGQVIGSNGKLIGETIEGDIVINNFDQVVGYINFDGKISDKNGVIIGKVISNDLAVDNNENILGKIYKIGATILNNEGKYIGRLNYKGIVVNEVGKNNGFIKSNGTYVDLDKNISGYALPEVAKNRRN